MHRRHRKTLPGLWLMTDERVSDDRLLAAARALPRGRAGIILRHYRTPPAQRRALFDALRAIARRSEVEVTYATDGERLSWTAVSDLETVHTHGPGWIVARAVAAWYDQRTTVLQGEIRQHPQCRKLHRKIRVGHRDMSGLLLIVGPVGVPATPLVTWVRHQGVGEGDPDVGPKPPCRHAKHTFIREVGQERGNLIENAPGAVHALVSATDALRCSYSLRLGTHCAHFVCGDDSLDRRPPVNLQSL